MDNVVRQLPVVVGLVVGGMYWIATLLLVRAWGKHAGKW